jgi:hypothetical protein
MPRPTALVDNLGAELLVLTQNEIDTLTTLKANLTLTGATMADMTQGKRAFGIMAARHLLNAVKHDMSILAQAFDEFAPSRKLQLPGKEPELAATILRRLSKASI